MTNYQAPSFHVLTPLPELERRLAAVRRGLRTLEIDAALLVFPVDVFHLSGTMQNAHLLVPAEGGPLLMVKRDLARARGESSLADIVGLTGFSRLPGLVNDRLGRSPARLGLELDVLPVNNFRKYQSLWPSAEFLDISPLLLDVRAIKSDWELDWMRRAGGLSVEVYRLASEKLREGRSEIELAGLMTAAAYAKGHQNLLRARAFGTEVYTWHVISGLSGGVVSSIDAPFGGHGLSPAFPVGAGLKPIRRAEPVLIDFGLCLGGYQVDLTRMFSLGKPADRLWKAFEALELIERELTRLLRPGVRAGDLYETAVDLGRRLGFEDNFLGPPGRKVKFAGHGVGLEINEPPLLAQGVDTVLQVGMTPALELKMVFPGLGAVGLENTFVIGNGPPEKLTLAESSWVVTD
ncbi:MAG: Xaa-Pro peptidase family protein [Pseudomonadota bacterium]